MHQARLVTALPQGAGAPLQAIAIPRGTGRESLHQLAEPGYRLARGQQQVNMVGHQAVGIHLDAKRILQLPQVSDVALVVVRFDKHHLTVMTALDDMVRIIW
ncbi:hypothetical protein D9M69_514000 [compost metagenome]